MKHLILIAATFALCSCATTMVPVGPNRYEMLRHSATTLASGTAEKTELLREASAFCAKQSKSLVIQSSTDRDAWLGARAASADIIFSCQ